MNKTKILQLIIALFISTQSYYQLDEILKPDSCIEEVDIIDPIEFVAKFPGRDDSLLCFIESQLNWDLIH